MDKYKKIQNILKEFSAERDWDKFHNEKDLAISISIEANELLENFQWKTSKESIEKNKNNIIEEMADVYIYILYLSNKLGIDIENEVLKKIEKNRRKYPVDKCFGTNKKYTEI